MIAVVAQTVEHATRLAEGLGIGGNRRTPGRRGDVVALGLTDVNTHARGFSFNAVLVDESAWPLPEAAVQDLAPTLFATDGRFYLLREVAL